MSVRKVSIIPDVEGNFMVIDYGRPQGFRRYRRPVRIIQPDILTLDVSSALPFQQSVRQQIATQLRDIITDAVQVGIDNDINLITGIANSPPIKIAPEEINRLPIILGGNRAKFQIVSINNRNITSFGQERVFKTAPPEIYWDSENYFEPDRKSLLFMDIKKEKEATCAYQYIYQTFGKVNGFKKLAGSYNHIKNWCEKEPPQYQSWLRQYARERNIEMLDLNIQQAIEKEVKSFETELFSVKTVEIGNQEEWTDEEKNISMNVLDIIRWCMWAKINCYVVDYDGQYYMSYNHKQIAEGHPDIKVRTGRRSIVVKVMNNHAYFVQDPDLKKSAGMRYETWKSEEFAEFSPYDKKSEEEKGENEFWIHPHHTIRHQAENYGIITAMDEEGIDPFEIGWDKAYELLGKSNPHLYRQNPPPTPQELIDDSGKTFYLGTDRLNGLVSHLYTHYNIKPDTMNGSTGHKIDRLNYGSNKIMGRSTLPEYSDTLLDNETIEDIKKLLPDIDWKRLPTIKTIADSVFDNIEKEQTVWSMLNSNTRRAFFDSEIKPDNQAYKEQLDSDSAWAVDISRAYTTALDKYDLEWNIYDAICQFEEYDGNFNPNYFYLVEELDTGFPLRNIKGLVLYHGCLLRHIMDKVDIKQVIKPIRTLPNDYFVDFVSDCKKLETLSSENISSKRLVNTFVGGLKNQDKLSHFKFHLTESDTTINRAFYSGDIVSRLDVNTEHKEAKELYLISKPNTQYNINTAQPIRLAIIDRINEYLYLLHKELQSALNEYNILFNRDERLNLCLTKTDCLYFEEQKHLVDKSVNPPIEPEPTDDETIKLGRKDIFGYDDDNDNNLWARPFPVRELIDYVYDKCLDKYSFSIRQEQTIDKEDWVFKQYKKQNQVLQKGNYWKNTIPVNHKWDKNTGAKKIFKVINTLGGAWIEGEGGVGKTEFLKTFQDIIDRNRIRYRFQKCIHKHNENPRMFEDLQEWRKDNPCFAIKLAPTNKACNNIGGKTLQKGLGIPVMDIDIEDKSPAYFDKICSKLAGDGYSKPCYDYAVFDEISFMDGWDWSLIYSLKRRIPHLKFILSGDIIRQLPPVGEEWRNFYNAYVIKELVGFTKIKFNYNFRTGISGNVLWKEWSKHPERFKVDNFHPITERNICFTNIKRKKVIAHLEDRVKHSGLPHLVLKKEYNDPYGGLFEEEEDYKPDGHRPELVIMFGTPLIACKSNKEFGIAKNEFRKVMSYDDDLIELCDGKKYEYKFIYDNFLSAYCITTHKSQGDTYRDKYTIHEWDVFSGDSLFKRRLRYVAQSRSTDPENNIVYKS